jgi:hypothetical protein
MSIPVSRAEERRRWARRREMQPEPEHRSTMSSGCELDRQLCEIRLASREVMCAVSDRGIKTGALHLSVSGPKSASPRELV